jgi:hypothetical protein
MRKPQKEDVVSIDYAPDGEASCRFSQHISQGQLLSEL